MLLDQIIASAQNSVKKRVWVVSDLQQALPERATHCMTRAAADFLSLGKHVDAICYLGDAVEGHNIEHLTDMTLMQEREFSKVDAPVYYAIGNHDFDYFRGMAREGTPLCEMEIPFVRHMRKNPQWHVQEKLSDFYYTVDMGEFALCVLTDHSDKYGRWFTTHGEIRGDASLYPYTQEDYARAMQEIAELGKPVITLSHYSFAGGNRAAPLFDRFLPLPDNIRMHIYGHAHIGDAHWAGKDCHRKICAVDNQPIMQINVASLENYRGTAIRSAILEWYDGGEIGVLFRNHTLHCWDDYLVVRPGDGQRAPEID